MMRPGSRINMRTCSSDGIFAKMFTKNSLWQSYTSHKRELHVPHTLVDCHEEIVTRRDYKTRLV